MGVPPIVVYIKVLPILFRSDVLLLKKETILSLGGSLRLVLCRIFTVQFMVRSARLLTMTAGSVNLRLVGLQLLPAILWNSVSRSIGLILWAYVILRLWHAGKVQLLGCRVWLVLTRVVLRFSSGGYSFSLFRCRRVRVLALRCWMRITLWHRLCSLLFETLMLQLGRRSCRFLGASSRSNLDTARDP